MLGHRLPVFSMLHTPNTLMKLKRIVVHMFIIGGERNNDIDSKENEKFIVLDWKNNNFASASCLACTFPCHRGTTMA